MMPSTLIAEDDDRIICNPQELGYWLDGCNNTQLYSSKFEGPDELIQTADFNIPGHFVLMASPIIQ